MNTETILVVEDSDEIRQFLCHSILERSGYRMISARDGIEGLEKALANKPDLILLDINMPGKSGLEVLQELKSSGLLIPAIVMTSYGSEENILKSLRLGAKDFLQKPFEKGSVLSAVSDALAETRWQRERAQMAEALTSANRRLQEQLKPELT